MQYKIMLPTQSNRVDIDVSDQESDLFDVEELMRRGILNEPFQIIENDEIVDEATRSKMIKIFLKYSSDENFTGIINISS